MKRRPTGTTDTRYGWHHIRNNTIQYIVCCKTDRHNIHYNTVHYDLIHVNTIQCDINIIQYNTIPIDTLQFDTTQYNCTIYHVRCILLVYNVQCTMYDVSICKYMYLYYVFVRTSVFVYVCTCIVRTSVFVYVCTCICLTCKSLCSLDKMNSGPKKSISNIVCTTMLYCRWRPGKYLPPAAWRGNQPAQGTAAGYSR